MEMELINRAIAKMEMLVCEERSKSGIAHAGSSGDICRGERDCGVVTVPSRHRSRGVGGVVCCLRISEKPRGVYSVGCTASCSGNNAARIYSPPTVAVLEFCGGFDVL